MTPTPEQLIEMLERARAESLVEDPRCEGAALNSSEYDALISALRQMRWQPIETAPKDGTHILVEGGEAYWRSGGPWFSCSAQRYIEWSPKSWMPLPSPPPTEGESTCHQK